jgi:UDP-4-amino-4-deoxy-L-arabinose-oxoglutarate aminotransferase
MNDSFLPFSKPSISESDIASVVDVLKSGWITTGSKTQLFEEAVKEYTSAPEAIALSSASGAMHLLLKALDLGPGDEVITPAMTWVSTVNLIELCGAKPVFADIDKDTLMISAETVEPLITERTKLIIPVHFAGATVNMQPLLDLAEKHGVKVVQDAAHAIGSEYKNERIGKSGTAIFSFHPIKNITTGEGGMFCTDDAALAERIRRLKFHGLGVDAYDRQTQGRSPQAEVIEPGYKYNLTDMASVLGLGQLERLDGFIERRTKLAERYLELLKDVPMVIPLGSVAHEERHAWHLFIVRLDVEKAGMDRYTFMSKLKEQGIGTGLHFRAVHTQKYYREKYQFAHGCLPSTEWNSDRICSLPLFPDMTFQDVERVVTAIKKVLL